MQEPREATGAGRDYFWGNVGRTNILSDQLVDRVFGEQVNGTSSMELLPRPLRATASDVVFRRFR